MDEEKDNGPFFKRVVPKTPKAPKTPPTQANNPLHGVTLAAMLEHLVELYDWEDLYDRIPINCFKNNPSIKSSLTFIRRTPWARERVEGLYLKVTRKK